MIPVRLSATWSRRLYVAIFIISLFYVALYSLHTFALVAIPEPLQIQLITAILAGVSLIGSVLLFIFAKKISSHIPGFLVYLFIVLAVAFSVQQTSSTASYFLPFWAIVSLFAALFGAYGWLSVLALIATFVSSAYLSSGLSTESIVGFTVSSIIPIITGLIVWHNATPEPEKQHSDVKSLATQLSEVATKSEIVINAIGDGVIAIDGQGVIQLINPAGQQILGWGKQDALMLNYKSIVKLTDEHNKDLPDSEDPFQQVLNTNQQARGNKIIAVTQSGKKIGISITVSPIGEPGSGAIAIFRDITNERAEEREQAEFISTASHEMRTPVASIEGYLGLAMNPNTATIDNRARDFIVKAHEAAQHLGRLFQDLLDVSKADDGRMSSIPKVVDVVPFAETIVQGLQNKASEKGLGLRLVPSGGNKSQRKIAPVFFVNQDNDHIREILNNLIENAIKYTREGEVVVDVTGTDDHVVISVKDTGLGIPNEDLSHLFQKFYRIENSDRQDIGGTGLGLYLARRLAESMQGRLWAESVYQQGSTFFLELPRISSQEAERLQKEQAATVPPTAPQDQPVFIPDNKPAGVAPTPASAVTSTPTQAPAPTQATQPVAPAVAPNHPSAPAAPSQPIQQPARAPIASSATQAPVQSPAPQQPAQAAVVPVTQQTPQPNAVTPQATQATLPVSPAPQQLTPPAQQSTLSTPRDSTPPTQITSSVRPATTVPRGESLSRDQIAERVKQLEVLAQQQRASVGPPR